jgi:IS605 OrfB family transposase
VDQGLANLAVNDRRVSFFGEQNEKVRRRGQGRPRALQKKRTRSATGALRRASGRQVRFQRHTSRMTAKAIVADAERDRCTIALEGVDGIRDRVQANRHQRARTANWGFAELRSLVGHKAALKGIAVALIHPRYTSQQCACCGLIDQRKRPNRDVSGFSDTAWLRPPTTVRL